jgi:hypothetical protein
MFDIFRVVAQGWGGTPKRKTPAPAPRPPPYLVQRNQKKILIERCGCSQVFLIDIIRPIQAITTQIAEEARIPNPSAWILGSLREEMIRDSREIVEGQTYRLKSTVRIEHGGKVKCFNIGEEEDGLMQHHRIHRGLGTDMDRWDILNAQGIVIEPGSKLPAGSLNFMLEKSLQEVNREGPKIVQIVHRWSRRTIPIQEADTLTAVMVLIEMLMRLRARWELRNETGQVVEHVTQFRHRGTCNVHLVNETRERTRTIIRRVGGDSEENDYV